MKLSVIGPMARSPADLKLELTVASSSAVAPTAAYRHIGEGSASGIVGLVRVT
jgi:hypothetical protein